MNGSVYVCSDLHGQYELFKRMLDAIQFGDEDRMYILGDIIDRGPASMPLMQDIMSRKNTISLIGNHELMMYDHLKHNPNWKWWMNGSNGGIKTKEQFMLLSEEEQVKIVRYIESMYLQVELELNGQTFLLSHSSFLPERTTVKFMEASPFETERVVWYSPWRFWEYEPERMYKEDGRTHIIGHVPVPYIVDALEEMPCAYELTGYGIVNIDLGCAAMGDPEAEGWLCCMDLTRYAQGDKEGAFRYWDNMIA